MKNLIFPPCFLLTEEEEEEEEGGYSSVPQASSESIFVDTRSYSSSRNRSNQRRQVMHSPKQSRDSGDDSSWPRFEDEEYIVFCFGEDGTFDVVKDGTHGRRESRTSSRPVNRKVSNVLFMFDVFLKFENKNTYDLNAENSLIMVAMKIKIISMAARMGLQHMRKIVSSLTKRCKDLTVLPPY